MPDEIVPIFDNHAAWRADFTNGWLKHHQTTGEFDWKLYKKPENTRLMSGAAISLRGARVVLISSAGAYLRDSQVPFDAAHPYGDYSIRTFPSATALGDIAIAHDHYDHQYVDADRQVLLPLRHLDDLAREGVIGSVSANVINFMGYQPDAARVADTLAPLIVETVYAEKADAAFLVPS